MVQGFADFDGPEQVADAQDMLTVDQYFHNSQLFSIKVSRIEERG